jgi:RNA polymerase-binding transcription factor
MWGRVRGFGRMSAKQMGDTRKMDSSEIQRLRRMLEVQRNEAIRVLDRLAEDRVESDAKDIGDFCTTTLSKEALFQLTSERRLMVRMIEAALARIQRGTFGICVACGEDINPRRLEALPWTRYCLRCQEVAERGGDLECKPDLDDRQVVLRKAG